MTSQTLLGTLAAIFCIYLDTYVKQKYAFVIKAAYSVKKEQHKTNSTRNVNPNYQTTDLFVINKQT